MDAVTKIEQFIENAIIAKSGVATNVILTAQERVKSVLCGGAKDAPENTVRMFRNTNVIVVSAVSALRVVLSAVVVVGTVILVRVRNVGIWIHVTSVMMYVVIDVFQHVAFVLGRFCVVCFGHVCKLKEHTKSCWRTL